MKIKRINQVLKSNLMLLVLLRESLAADGSASTPLYAAVAAQAQLTGSVLPESMRMTAEEVKTLRRAAVASKLNEMGPPEPGALIQTGNKVPLSHQLPKAGGMLVLDPAQLAGKMNPVQ